MICGVMNGQHEPCEIDEIGRPITTLFRRALTLELELFDLSNAEVRRTGRRGVVNPVGCPCFDHGCCVSNRAGCTGTDMHCIALGKCRAIWRSNTVLLGFASSVYHPGDVDQA